MGKYEEAKKAYAAYGVDTESALERLKNIPVSVHCWQGDDVLGFDGSDSLEGGIQTTGNYPGKAVGFDQLKQDIKEAFSLMPGKKRLNLHASYAVLGKDKGKVDRDAYTYEYFKPWVDFAKENNFDGIDFNPTFFSHPKMKNGLTISSGDEEIRSFWVRHGKACMKIAAEIGKAMGSPCLVNLWAPDGSKDIPADRLTPRLRMKESLDEILEGYDKEWVIPAVESKYSTYAQDTTPQGLRASRDHRGFGGFSMGSVNTWATFRYALDYFRYFMPMSGSYSLDGSYMASLAKAQGYGPQDFFIFAASGTNDFAYRAFKAQIMTMAGDSDGFFTLADSELGGNLSFREHEGYEHNATACDEYTYNGLCFFWNASQPTG